MSGDNTIVREASSEPPDPFGDAPFGPSAPEPARVSAPTPASPERGIVSGVAAWGAARVIGLLVAIAFTTGGFGLFAANLGNDGPPNVPTHVLDACNLARIHSGLAYSAHYAYEQQGANQLVRFRTSDDMPWDCLWNPASATASIQVPVP